MWTSLHIACKSGRVSVAQQLLDHGANVNCDGFVSEFDAASITIDNDIRRCDADYGCCLDL